MPFPLALQAHVAALRGRGPMNALMGFHLKFAGLCGNRYGRIPWPHRRGSVCGLTARGITLCLLPTRLTLFSRFSFSAGRTMPPAPDGTQSFRSTHPTVCLLLSFSMETSTKFWFTMKICTNLAIWIVVAALVHKVAQQLVLRALRVADFHYVSNSEPTAPIVVNSTGLRCCPARGVDLAARLDEVTHWLT